MKEIQAALDSLMQEKQKENNNRIKDSLKKAKEKHEQKIEKPDEKRGTNAEAYTHIYNGGFNFVLYI